MGPFNFFFFSTVVSPLDFRGNIGAFSHDLLLYEIVREDAHYLLSPKKTCYDIVLRRDGTNDCNDISQNNNSLERQNNKQKVRSIQQ